MREVPLNRFKAHTSAPRCARPGMPPLQDRQDPGASFHGQVDGHMHTSFGEEEVGRGGLLFRGEVRLPPAPQAADGGGAQTSVEMYRMALEGRGGGQRALFPY